MGGVIGLTIRIAPGQEYRGSCWTNILPTGLWAADFYRDLETSAQHTWSWIQTVLENRRQDPKIEELWGGHDMCAPIHYGLVLVDYVTRTFVSVQDYSAPDWMIRWPHAEELCEKWAALEKAGLLGEPVVGWNDASTQALDEKWPERHPARYIKLPFETGLIGSADKITLGLMRQVDVLIGLTDAEKAAWETFIRERNE